MSRARARESLQGACGKFATVRTGCFPCILILSYQFASQLLGTEAQIECTIEAPLAFSGVGLHSGAPVTMRLIPAPAGSGVVFRRTDLDNFEIPANGRNVAKVSYATSLMRQGVLISTTEHLLCALIVLGVDTVIIEIDNLEVPILDGSARPYVEAMLGAGLKRQRRKREYIRILNPVEVRESSGDTAN